MVRRNARPTNPFSRGNLRRLRTRRIANNAASVARNRGLRSGISNLPLELRQQVFENYHRGLMNRRNSRGGAPGPISRGAVNYSRARTRNLVN